MKYIQKIDEREIYGDGIGKVCLWDFSRANQNEESRIEAVATVASICYGKPPKDAKKLVERLWTESGGLPSSAFEFIRAGDAPYIELSLRNEPDLETDECYAKDKYGKPVKTSRDEHKKNIATFLIRVPIFVARQVVRHRMFSYQELSRRYTTDKRVPFEFWKPFDGPATEWWDGFCAYARDQYEYLVDGGIRPEAARAVLPQALYTQFWLQSDVPGLKNYFKLRTNPHAQREHRELAEAMLSLLEQHQPELWRKVQP